MKNIVVHTGYVPASIVQRTHTLTPNGIPAHLIMMTPEMNIVNKTNQLLDSLPNDDTLEIATNNVIAVYAVRAYIVKHPNDYKVEYRYYTLDDYHADDKSHYQLITQNEHGDFINAPDGFFDTIDNLLLQMLGLHEPTPKKRIPITVNDKRIVNDIINNDEKLHFLKELAGYETECILYEDWLESYGTKIEQINFYKTLQTEHERFIYATAIGQQYALDLLSQPIETLLKAYDLERVNTFFKNIEFYYSESEYK